MASSSSSKKHVIILSMAITTIAIINGAFAKEYTVGDEKGWKLEVNYTDWAHGKSFFVGDTLVFKYVAQYHNVIKVTEPEYKACKASENNVTTLNTGNDVITLDNTGSFWFLCGVATHCTLGQKLTVLVQAPAPTSPASSVAPSTAPTGVISIRFSAVLAGVAVIVLFL